MKTIQSFQDHALLIYSTLHKLNIPEPFDDYYQEAYLVYQKSVRTYNPSRAKFTTYFVYKLNHHIRDLLKKEQSYKSIVFYTPPSPNPDETLHEQSLLYDLENHSNLTPQEKSVFLLTYQGFTIKEIAHKMEVSESTIKRRRKNIKEKTQGLLFMVEDNREKESL
ncbi:sigma-70 family RNA polymerase sigma factor [Halobacillus mangrovi]|uniref:sigma-70 family RNA polymerase sigma factor n=1 Tax=Halobacillus mangrovi TaxID=402384 RepID=UPI003D96BEA9